VFFAGRSQGREEVAMLDMHLTSALKGGRSKIQRVEARVTAEQKELYRLAADLEGCSFTDFVTRALDSAAENAVQRRQVIRLCVRDSRAFVDALLNPGEPNERLCRYARRYKELPGD
jgi:uncharacterized protein (DUF1778 family)